MNSGNRLSNRICVFTLLLALMLLLLTGSSSTQAAEVSEGTDGMFYAHVNGSVLPILAADNSSADAFLDLLKAGDVTIDMHDYGSFEKVGSLGTTLSRNDEQITTEPGDVILYQGNQVTDLLRCEQLGLHSSRKGTGSVTGRTERDPGSRKCHGHFFIVR